MVRHRSLAVSVIPGRLSSLVTTSITSGETTSVAGVSGACCAVCRSQRSRIAIGVKIPEPIPHGSYRLLPTDFDATARFQDLMEVLQEPPPLVPFDPFPCVLDVVYRHLCHQDPFQRICAVRWLWFPHTNDPRLDLRFREHRPVHRWLDTHFLPTDLYKSITSRALTLGGNRQDPTTLREQRTSQSFETLYLGVL